MDYEYLINWFLSGLGMIGSILFVVFFFGMCVFVHELGHFLVARWRGLHVDAFSIGFKKIWAKKINGVEYRIGCLPLGGYVELPQVDSSDATPHAADGTELPRAKPLDRMLTGLAGPVCNILFGLALGCVVWWWGIPQDTPRMRTVEVASINPDSPEYRAGLRIGDRIVKINGKTFFMAWKDFVAEILTTIDEVDLEVERQGETVHISYLPATNPHMLQVEKTAYPFFLPRIPLEFHPDKGSPADRAGIRGGDELVSINGHDFDDFVSVQMLINYYGDKPLEFEMRRSDGERYTVTVTPEAVPDELNFLTVYYTGVVLGPNLQVQGLFRDFPAEKAGIMPGDTIVAYNGKPVHSFDTFTELVQEGADKESTLTVRRGGREETFKLTAKAVRPRSIGVSFMLRDHPTPWQQFYSLIELTAKSLRSMGVKLANSMGLTESQSNLSARNMSGPLGMAVMLYRSVQLSPAMGLYFVVMISFALAIFNLLPIPVLDGGHVFLALLEMIFRRPMPVLAVRWISYAFISFLVVLMVYVTWIDVLRVMDHSMRGSAPPAGTSAQSSGDSRDKPKDKPAEPGKQPLPAVGAQPEKAHE
ncbi:hypothetical protein SDC9_81016 [bioreactor metagenome]|uniref:PDZ domain-containing protein n=1 Tax=bioreactor metagenome TaxID=1076179 RepID=A0A644Z6T8_9ZZZZ